MKKAGVSPFQTILLIDSSAREKINVAVSQNGKVYRLTRAVRAQALPETIADFLEKHHLTPAQIEAVAVTEIADSLTGSRIGVTVANSLGWLLNIPIIGLKTSDWPEALKLLAEPKNLTPTTQARVINEVVY